MERSLHREAREEGHQLVGTLIDGRYRVLRVIGQGGLGIVFECENIVLRRAVALKIVSDLRRENAFERLRREAQIIAALQHPNICDVYDVGAIPYFGPYLVTERLYGETVAARFRWQRTMSPRETVDIVAQVLSGLHAAHIQSIVHRDIKPANVFIVDRLGCSPLVKILDFGLAKDLTADTTLTRPGKTLGTPQYMAPEQLLGVAVSGATDLFAVAVLAYEMLTGTHPFSVSSVSTTQARILSVTPEPPSRLNRRIPALLDEVLLRALAKVPRERYATAACMQQALMDALPLDDFDDEPTPTSYTGPGSHA
jgi:eukaryotic-like serine/threonine-protein kinase